jgi:hypothetical protein
MDGFVCERCGLVIEGGLFAEAVFRRHVEEHLAAEAAVLQITDDDRIFLKVNRIAWNENV